MKLSPVLALIIANVIWGAAAPIFKYALTDIPPFTLLFIRFFFASLIFLPALKGFHWTTLNKKDWLLILGGAITGFTIHIGLLFIGLEKTESINAPIIMSSSPIFLFILSILFLHEKVRLKVLTGMILSTVGVLVIILSPILLSSNYSNDAGAIEGNILYAFSTLANVVSILLLKKVSQKLSPYVMTFFIFIISSITFFPLMISEFQSWNFTMLDFPGFVGIMFGLFFSSALAYYLYFYGLSKLSGQEVGIFAYCDPIVAVLVAMPLVQEYPSIYFILGSIFVFVGIFISEGRLNYHQFHKLKKGS